MKKLCIAGAGGFGKEVLCCYIDSMGGANFDYKNQVVFMVDDAYHQEEKILEVPIIKKSDFQSDLYRVAVAMGDPNDRMKMVDSLPNDTEYATIIHPSAVISRWVQLGDAAIVTAGCVLTCDIKIGNHAHFNLLTTIGHDCMIGDFFTTAPGANISGSCHIGNRVYLGTNCSIREKLKICDDVTIGMGAVVTKSIVERGVYIGNPLRKK